MRNRLPVVFLIIILTSGCAPAISREVNSYERGKKCGNNEIKLTFFVNNPSGAPDEDIFTKELIVKMEFLKSKYGSLILWLYYKEADPLTKRGLPEYMPDKITVETNSINKKVSKKDFAEVWREFMTPMNLTFIENCLFN